MMKEFFIALIAALVIVVFILIAEWIAGDARLAWIIRLIGLIVWLCVLLQVFGIYSFR